MYGKSHSTIRVFALQAIKTKLQRQFEKVLKTRLEEEEGKDFMKYLDATCEKQKDFQPSSYQSERMSSHYYKR